MEKQNKEESKVSLNNEIRNSLYNELVKKTKISINEQLFNALINRY